MERALGVIGTILYLLTKKYQNKRKDSRGVSAGFFTCLKRSFLMQVSFGLDYEFSHDCDDEVKAKEDIETTLKKSMFQFLSEFPGVKNVTTNFAGSIIVRPNRQPYGQCAFLFNFHIEGSYPCKILQQVVDTLEANFDTVILKKVSEYPVIKSVKKPYNIEGSL